MFGAKMFQKLSQAPTNPHARESAPAFDVASLYEGPVQDGTGGVETSLHEKLRQAYFWIVNTAIISPHYDIEYNEGPPQTYTFGDAKTLVTLPSGQSYSSFVLLPLLTFATRRKCLFIGGPGRGKTASALLMGVLGGYSLLDVKRGMQHGHPQMTIAELLGNPLPSDLLNAQKLDEIRIAWRKWLGMRVKIVDEYNRIPTRTQSALLTLMSDNYAEVFDQVYECPESAWFLTANDDLGGGTYQVIEALRDRIDIVVQALAFNARFLGDLLVRIEERVHPEEVVPPAIIFNEAEIEAMNSAILRVAVPQAIRRRLEFFTSQFEFLESAAAQLEYKTKDTVRLSGIDLHLVTTKESGKDKIRDLGSQTKNGLSVRALMTLLHYAKAIAFFRGESEVSLNDVRQTMPFVLYAKLTADIDSPFFDLEQNQQYRSDRISWLRTVFDNACQEYDRLALDTEDPVLEIETEFAKGLDGVSEKQVRAQLVRIERTLAGWAKGGKLYGPMYDDILKLKYFHQRYTNYLHWLVAQ